MTPDIAAKLKEHFGFDTFKGTQEAIIRNVLEGNDTFVLMPTGGGKSLCYQLPAILMEGTAIVISPLIALMKNQVDAMRFYSSDNGIAHFMNSSLTKVQLEEVRDDVRSGITKLLYVAPESLTKEQNIAFLQSIKISFYAIDEAHCISEWGHDFRPEYRRIRPIINEIGVKPLIALTATATPKVQHDIQKNLGMTETTVFKSSFNRPNLYYQIKPKREDIDADIVRFVLSNPNKSGIIYCMSRNRVTTFAQVLQANGIRALPYHAGMDAKERAENQDAFLNEDAEVIVATIAFGMGIDKPDVRYVIHYDMPKSLEGYYQETGRAGRDEGEGLCIAYYRREDLEKLEKFMKGKPIGEQEIGRQLLTETAAYAESGLCRRKMLLHYFGEDYLESNCSNCDNCLSPKKLVEAKEIMISVLEAVALLKGKFKGDYIVDILQGKESGDSDSLGHEDFELFGQWADVDERIILSVIRQALISKFLKKDIEHYGLLSITTAGKKFLKQPESIKVVDESSNDDDDEDSVHSSSGGAPSGGAADPTLYAMMKDLRKKLGSQHKVPPYVIFQDTSLEAMSTFYPITMDELQNIPGVGAGKAARYGKEFLQLIKRHVEDNEIERPEDLRVRTLANKSRVKIAIVQQIDRKVALDDIASSHGLDFDELLTEVEAIVYSGTRIYIDYFIDEVIDTDRQNEAFYYFKESTTDSIDEALNELGDDFSEEEIRLLRIKFISDMAN